MSTSIGAAIDRGDRSVRPTSSSRPPSSPDARVRGLLGCRDARFERRHDVDHLRLLGGDLGDLELFAVGLHLDERHHCFAVLVVILLGLEVGGERRDERLGHRDFLVVDLDRIESLEFVDVGGIDHLVGIGERRHHEASLLGADRRGVLLVAHHEPADRHFPAGLHRSRQQHVGLGRTVGGEVVGGVEVHRVDVDEVDELLEVDRLGGHRHERLELVRVDDDVATLGDLVALHDVVVADLFTGLGVDLSVADAGHVAFVELVERHALSAHRMEQLDGDRHQPERDRATPHRPCHGQSQSHRDDVRTQAARTARGRMSMPNAGEDRQVEQTGRCHHRRVGTLLQRCLGDEDQDDRGDRSTSTTSSRACRPSRRRPSR